MSDKCTRREALKISAAAVAAAFAPSAFAQSDATLRHPEVNGKLTEAGFEVMATDGPALDRYAREQHDRWAAFVKRTGLKVEE